MQENLQTKNAKNANFGSQPKSATDLYKPLEKTLKLHARGLGIPDGAADAFIKETLKSVKKSLKDKKLITDQDLKRAVIKELKKYHKDFAYVYEKCDTIV